MNNAVNDFYKTKSDLMNELEVLDGMVDFSNGTEFISKTGIRKDLRGDSIEIILDLVRMGKIDPWNIDIIDLYDKYMERIKELKQDNLRTAGKAILFSSTLLKIKSDILQGLSVNDFALEPEDYFEDDGFSPDDYEQLQIPTNNIVSFDEVLERRTSVRLNRKSTVTLKDLIRHIQFYEDLEKRYAIKSALEKKERRVRNYANLKTEDIKELAHEEYVEEVVEKMRQNLEQILQKEEKIELRELCLLGFDRTSAYVALLFLCREGKFTILQNDFYGKIFASYSKEENIEETDEE